jgi:hypothetical protein
MPDEPDIFALLALIRDSPPGPEGLAYNPPASNDSDPEAAMCEIAIERDLAVQLVGSDAGKARRIRPHGAMTKGSSDEEFADVRVVMEPFMKDEIRRVHEDKTHRPMLFLARATCSQAASLKAYCLRFAASLEMNLEKHPGDDNRHRSQQRLEQARRVIAQVNAGLGIPQEGPTIERCRREAIVKAESLDAALAALRGCIGNDDDRAVSPLLELQEAVRRCLDLCASS